MSWGCKLLFRAFALKLQKQNRLIEIISGVPEEKKSEALENLPVLNHFRAYFLGAHEAPLTETKYKR